jgi:hypothetical protein
MAIDVPTAHLALQVLQHLGEPGAVEHCGWEGLSVAQTRAASDSQSKEGQPHHQHGCPVGCCVCLLGCYVCLPSFYGCLHSCYVCLPTCCVCLHSAVRAWAP